MTFQRTKISAITAGVALAVSAMAVQAADQPNLGSVGAGAGFSGGATINGGASYLSTVPAADPVDLVATITPAAADVGKTGNLVAILIIPGLGNFNLLSGGIWVQWDGNASSIKPFATKTLASAENVNILNDLIGSDTNLTGVEFQAYVGYYMNSIADIKYSAAPAKVTISTAPASGCPANTSAISGTFAGKPVCQLSSAARITSNTHLTNNYSYLVNGTVFIGNNTVTDPASKIALTIDAGTVVFAPNGQNTLVIDKSAKIFSNGTPANPVVMTTEADNEFGGSGVNPKTTRSTWGGLVINGAATVNTSSGTAEGEGSTGTYGGTNDADDSGMVTYTQIRYAGWPITPENELNSLALQGVGNKTILDYIHIHNGGDDSIEFFGGTVNAKHLLLTGDDDDSLDWTQGYRGMLQHIMIVKTSTGGEGCIEADNLSSNNDASPRARPIIANLTCIGSATADRGARLRAGTGIYLTDSVFTSTPGECFIIDGAATFAAAHNGSNFTGELTVRNTYVDTGCGMSEGNGSTFTTDDWFAAGIGNAFGTVDLGGPWGWANGSTINARPANTPANPFFDKVDYIGAIKDQSSDWTKGWLYSNWNK